MGLLSETVVLTSLMQAGGEIRDSKGTHGFSDTRVSFLASPEVGADFATLTSFDREGPEDDLLFGEFGGGREGDTTHLEFATLALSC